MENQNYEIAFTIDIASPILDMLSKHQLHETADQLSEKFKTGKRTNGESVRIILQDIAMGKEKKENIARLLQESLGARPEIATEMAKYLETEILPNARKVLIEPEPEPKPKTLEENSIAESSFIKKPEFKNVEENAKAIGKQSRGPVLSEGKLEEPEETKLPKDKIPRVPERPKTAGPDTYREPIG